MQTSDARTRRMIEVNRGVFAPTAPRPQTVWPKTIADFPGVAPVHLAVAQKLASPLLTGPPVCDELVAFVEHLFTEEEAGIVWHLGPFAGRSAADLAKAEHRLLDQIAPLHRLAVGKRAIAASGSPGTEKYRLMPIMPGIFQG